MNDKEKVEFFDELQRCQSATIKQKEMFSLLLGLMNYCFTTLAEQSYHGLALACQMTDSTVRNRIAKLIEIGWVEITYHPKIRGVFSITLFRPFFMTGKKLNLTTDLPLVDLMEQNGNGNGCRNESRNGYDVQNVSPPVTEAEAEKPCICGTSAPNKESPPPIPPEREPEKPSNRVSKQEQEQEEIKKENFSNSFSSKEPSSQTADDLFACFDAESDEYRKQRRRIQDMFKEKHVSPDLLDRIALGACLKLPGCSPGELEAIKREAYERVKEGAIGRRFIHVCRYMKDVYEAAGYEWTNVRSYWDVRREKLKNGESLFDTIAPTSAPSAPPSAPRFVKPKGESPFYGTDVENNPLAKAYNQRYHREKKVEK